MYICLYFDIPTHEHNLFKQNYYEVFFEISNWNGGQDYSRRIHLESNQWFWSIYWILCLIKNLTGWINSRPNGWRTVKLSTQSCWSEFVDRFCHLSLKVSDLLKILSKVHSLKSVIKTHQFEINVFYGLLSFISSRKCLLRLSEGNIKTAPGCVHFQIPSLLVTLFWAELENVWKSKVNVYKFTFMVHWVSPFEFQGMTPLWTGRGLKTQFMSLDFQPRNISLGSEDHTVILQNASKGYLLW